LDGRFIPEESEKQGKKPEPALRSEPGEEVIAESKQIVIDRLKQLLEKPIPAAHSGNQKDRAARLLLIAEAYNTSWTPAYHDPRAIEQIVQDGDSMASDFASKPNYAAADWPGAGPLGEAIIRTEPTIVKRLDETTTIAGKQVQRRDSWASA